jgi:hypothetical protein
VLADEDRLQVAGRLLDSKGNERTGIFTSGVVSTTAGRRVSLYFTGRRHAGENLERVLRHRIDGLAPPIQMCDALSRNELPSELKVILANCLAHSRRRFVDVVENFPTECRYVLERLAVVYKNDETARKRSLSPQERRDFHRAHSAPVMDELSAWMKDQIEGKKTEPNSGLGEAIVFARKHWEKLTRFLAVPGAPLDSNVVERALKRAIIHRKNSMFFKTENGARVGDVFMSLISTCQHNGVNPYEYLTVLQEHAAEVQADPKAWLPWCYRQTLARMHDAPGVEKADLASADAGEEAEKHLRRSVG